MGKKYAPVDTSFTDWRIFSTLKFNGLLGLKYFKDKRRTIDYKEKKIGIPERPFVYRAIKNFSRARVPLLEASASQVGSDLCVWPDQKPARSDLASHRKLRFVYRSQHGGRR